MTSLPQGWQRKTLRNLVRLNYGKSPQGSLSEDGSVPVVGTGGIERLGTQALCEEDTIVLGRKGSIDQVQYFSGHCWPIDTTFYTSDLQDSDPEWLYYFLTTVDLRGLSEATGVPSLARDSLYSIGVPKPPPVQQRKIAAVLSTIDKAIAQTEALIAKQQRIKTALMQDLLTRGIDEHGNLRSEETHAFKDSPLGRIPVEWEALSFGEAIERDGGLIQTGPFGSQLHATEYVPEGVPVVMPQDIDTAGISTNGIARVTQNRAETLSRHRMEFGDVVFARRGDLSQCARIGTAEEGWICGTGCLLMRPPAKRLSPYWVTEIYRYFRSQRQVNALCVGTTMLNLNTSVLSKIVIPLPGLDEQRGIQEAVRAADEEQRVVEARSSKLGAQKAALMQDLLTGKVSVTPLLEAEAGAS